MLTVGRLDRGLGLGTSSVQMVFQSAGVILLTSSPEQVRAVRRVRTWSTKTEGGHWDGMPPGMSWVIKQEALGSERVPVVMTRILRAMGLSLIQMAIHWFMDLMEADKMALGMGLMADL